MSAKFLDSIAARHRAELYCESHPGSPSAIRAPRIFLKSGVWIALLGKSVRQGIAGFGPTVEAALGAFDREYLNYLHHPRDRAALDQAA
ncbi:MAG TPA: hypothetical protein VGW57_07405 [Chthoniobacterales bacterium]|nr:hypothetical protein [Chthoniobacterales bacterium]